MYQTETLLREAQKYLKSLESSNNNEDYDSAFSQVADYSEITQNCRYLK
jgi:hypothetical protein